jgi:anaerobic dimethyl sulfoxide reductase subunit B
MSYAFTFDATACTGCKACQEACKDKNNLPAGVLWRRVIEVTGGEWRAENSAWENSIFAYNLSLACNHCTHPKCAGVCPTDAYVVRPDGIVFIETTKCMGCGYCAWACPYGVPQYDPSQGVMTKCDFCYDSIDAGLPPSCVAACPLRVLDYGHTVKLETIQQEQNLWQHPGSEHPFPLPVYSRTEPHLAIKPHAAMNNPLVKAVSNVEEVLPPRSFEAAYKTPGSHELPLVAFTLFIQLAAGMAVGSLLLPSIPMSVLLSIGLLLGIGGLISFLHLGRKRNAWRAILHINKSWLSREVLMASLFGLAWVTAVGVQWYWKASPGVWPMALLGLGLVYSMSRVYLLRAVAAWNSWRTPTSFFLSAVVLGALGINLASPNPGWIIAAGLGMVVEMVMVLTAPSPMDDTRGNLRNFFLGLGIVAAVLLVAVPQAGGEYQAMAVFVIALASEVLGRWQFYARRKPFPMQSN